MLNPFFKRTNIRAAKQSNKASFRFTFSPNTDKRTGISAAIPAKSSKARSKTENAIQTPRFRSLSDNSSYICFNIAIIYIRYKPFGDKVSSFHPNIPKKHEKINKIALQVLLRGYLKRIYMLKIKIILDFLCRFKYSPYLCLSKSG